MIIDIETLTTRLRSQSALKYGCVVDTNVLVASAHTTDSKNDWAEELIEVLQSEGVPIYTNMNVRSEFIHLSRRKMLPESLMDFRSDLHGQLPHKLELKLNSIRTSLDQPGRKAPFQLQEDGIKQLRALFHEVYHPHGQKQWLLFCSHYFLPFIEPAWNDVVELTRVNFLGSEEILDGTHFNSRPSWKNAVEVVGKTGIGSADAMIVNFFAASKFPILATTDTDIAFALHGLGFLSEDRIVVVPT